MSGSLFWKLIAAFAVVVLVGIGGALLLAGYAAEAEFRRYAHAGNTDRWAEDVADLAEYYSVNGSWDGVEVLFSGRRGLGRGVGSGPPVRLADSDGQIVAGQSGEDEPEVVSAEVLQAGWPVVVDGVRVGTLLMPGGELLTLDQQEFLDRVRGALMVSGGVALLVALLLGVLFVRSVTRPLRRLVDASQSIAAGDLGVAVPVRSRDEIGQLAAAFNQMAADLARAEQARRQQTADIAHELRTPLTIIQGHLEALADGIFPADSEHLAPVLEQAQLLARLVEDLRTLSLADAGRLALDPVPTDMAGWVASVVAGFQTAAAEQGVVLEMSPAGDLPIVNMDPERATQALGNLLDNALRHTPEGGRIDVRVTRQDIGVVVSVSDTGPGVPPEHLSHLFERFWRGDHSRSRRTGGSGLGLAIARQVVEGHGGRIWAENAAGGGLQVSFSLPAVPGRQ